MRTPLLIGTLLAALTPLVSAQETIAPGFAVTDSTPPAVAFAVHGTLSDGSRVYFDGSTVDLYDPSGVFVMNLGAMPGFLFSSFVEIDPSETFAIIGESSNGGIYKAQLDGTGMTLLNSLTFNFDAVFESANEVLISASHFGVDNDVLRLNTDSGAFEAVANLPGFSGPLDLTPGGDLVYGEVSGAGARILRFDAAELTSGMLLTELDADILTTGLDGAAALAVDPVFGNIFVTSNIWSVSSLLLEIDGDGAIVETIASSTAWLNGIEFVQGAGAGHFHRYQPADGLSLQYSNGTDIVTVSPQAPQLSLTQFGNFATLQVTGAVPNAGALIVFGNQNLMVPEYSVQLAFDFLFNTDLPLANIRRLGLRIPTDTNGEASFSYFDPSPGSAGQRWFQMLITDENDMFVGASNSAVN